MKTDTLDIIVREALMDAGLSLHYYFDFLNYAIKALEEFNYDNEIDVKITTLSITDYQRAVIPSDLVQIVDISAKYGEYLLPLAYDKSLNTTYNYDGSGNKIPFNTTNDTNFIEEILYTSYNYRAHISDLGEHMGRFFGASTTQTQTFNIDEINSEIVFSNDVEVSEVTVTYVSDGLSTSEANTVTPIIKDYIREFCHYMRHKHGPYPMNLKMMYKNDMILAKKKAKSRVSALSYADIVRSIRRGLHAGPKN